MVKVTRCIEGNIKMPKSIVIGDPLYFDEMPDRDDLVYNRSFENQKDWLGHITLKEEIDEFEIDGKAYESPTYIYNVYFGPNQKKLDVYKENKYYSHQREKETIIGVDTACYHIGIGDKSDDISTASDGFWGSVSELYANDELDGLIVDMAFPGELFNFDDAKRELEYLFDFKF